MVAHISSSVTREAWMVGYMYLTQHEARPPAPKSRYLLLHVAKGDDAYMHAASRLPRFTRPQLSHAGIAGVPGAKVAVHA